MNLIQGRGGEGGREGGRGRRGRRERGSEGREGAREGRREEGREEGWREGEGRMERGSDDPYTYSNRPLSRRMYRCDRIIQDESGDSSGVMCNTSQCELRSLRVNSGMLNVISHCDVLHITPVRVAILVLDCNGVFAIKAYRYVQ